tara:strand:- start:2053 stop:2883 length:831 start_codon:yes stop_codon:yes gene_type:complete
MIYKKLLLIQVSAGIAETATFPIDYVKTLMQINQQKTPFFSILSDISHSKNKFQIYNGLKPAVLRHSIYTMMRINIYEHLRDTMKTSDGHISTPNSYLIGGISGGVSQLVASPCDLLKIRYITNIKKQNQKTLRGTIKQIYNENGIKGLWKGATPNVSRAMMVNLGELATYDQSKQYIKKTLHLEDNTPLHLLSSGCSGFVASLCCTPADVIKSRMMQSDSPYNGIGNCIVNTIRNEGFLSLYKGFFPIWFRLAPWQLIFWVSYERLRIISGLESF